ncbi:unnamed protein product [Boreogadus saida]
MAGRLDANTPHSGEPDDELGELDNILADLQDESEKYGAGTKAKRKKPEKLVRWKKRDHYGRLIAEIRQSSGGAGPSSHPKDTCPVHMDPCPDDASNYACMEDIAAISVDGNRKMYRFNQTKGTDESGYFDGAFFSKDKEVAEFVEGIRNRIKPVSDAILP